MTTTGHCPHSHREVNEDTPMPLVIPKPVNKFLDWCVRYPGLAVSVFTYVAALVAVWVLPSWAIGLAGAGAGVYIGWYLHSPRLGRLREELDDAHRAIGRLEEKNRVLMRGRVAEDIRPTQFMPRIGDDR